MYGIKIQHHQPICIFIHISWLIIIEQTSYSLSSRSRKLCIQVQYCFVHMKSTNWNVGTSWILQWQDLIRYEFIYDHFVVDKISKEILGLIKFSARQNIESIWRLLTNGKKQLWQYKVFCCGTNVHRISWIFSVQMKHENVQRVLYKVLSTLRSTPDVSGWLCQQNQRPSFIYYRKFSTQCVFSYQAN